MSFKACAQGCSRRLKYRGESEPKSLTGSMLLTPQKGQFRGERAARTRRGQGDGEAKVTRHCVTRFSIHCSRSLNLALAASRPVMTWCVEQFFREVSGVGKRQGSVDGLQFMDEMEQNLDARSQVQDASDLTLSLKRHPNAVVLPEAFQSAFILQGKARGLVANPHVDNGVIVLPIGRPRNGVEGCDFDLRLPSRQQVRLGQCQLNCDSVPANGTPAKHAGDVRNWSAGHW